MNAINDKNVEVEMNVSCGIIIKTNDKGEKLFLLIQRHKDDHFPLMWEPPRGKCDNGKNEPLIACLKREIKEETGLDINKDPEFIDSFIYYADNGKRKTTQYNFLCTLKNPNQEVKISNEHQDYRWVRTLGEVELITMPEIKKTLSKIIDNENKIVNYDEFEKPMKISESSILIDVYLNIDNSYSKYINETKEIITLEEFKFLNEVENNKEKYRNFEHLGKLTLKYGLSMALGGPIGGLLLYMYRYMTDACTKRCKRENDNNSTCRFRCYQEASKSNLNRIKEAMSKLSKIKDPEKRNREKNKLEKQYRLWSLRYNHYTKRLNKANQSDDYSDDWD